MSASSAGQGRRAAKLQAADGVQQTEIQQYMERIKLKELFQAGCSRCRFVLVPIFLYFKVVWEVIMPTKTRAFLIDRLHLN